MGSSAKKKAGKKADFKRLKLRVGKARPKPTNVTDASFKARSIAIPNQTLHATAATPYSQISTHLSHLHSNSSSLRYEHLGALGALLTARQSLPIDSVEPLPVSYSTLLNSLNQLILDSDNRVRSQLLKVYTMIPAADMADNMEKTLPFVRAGMAHLSPDIRSTTLDIFSWLFSAEQRTHESHTAVSLGECVVGCAGGWLKGLKIFAAIFGWTVLPTGADNQDTEAAAHARRKVLHEETVGLNMAVGKGQTGLTVKAVLSLAKFLRAGLQEQVKDDVGARDNVRLFPLRNIAAHMIPQQANSFSYLNLFNVARDQEGEIYENAQNRWSVFRSLGYESTIRREIELMKLTGGEVGRAAAMVGKAMH